MYRRAQPTVELFPMPDESASTPVTRSVLAGGLFSPTALELDRTLPISEVAVLVGLSQHTLRRHYRHLIRRLTPGRVGIRLRDALAIGSNDSTTTTA